MLAPRFLRRLEAWVAASQESFASFLLLLVVSSNTDALMSAMMQ